MWAFSEEERIADMAVAKDAGSLDCFFRSGVRRIMRHDTFRFDILKIILFIFL